MHLIGIDEITLWKRDSALFLFAAVRLSLLTLYFCPKCTEGFFLFLAPKNAPKLIRPDRYTTKRPGLR